MSAEQPLVRPEFPDFSFAVPDARASRRSPVTRKRSQNMSGSWDDFGNSKRMLKASLNSEDLSLLLDSLESSRAASPSLQRALRLSPAPSPVPARFLSSSPAIQRKLSQSLSSLLSLSHGNISIPSGAATTNVSCNDFNPPPRRDASATSIPTLSITPPVPAEPPSADALPSHPMAVSMASTNRFAVHARAPALTNSSACVTVEQAGLAPTAHNSNATMEYQMMHPLGYYAEQVVLPPTAAPAGGFVMATMPADSAESFNFTYVGNKSADPAHHHHTGAPAGWNCKCAPKDFRAVVAAMPEPMTTGNCKASGNYSVCPKNFVVADNSKQAARPHKQAGGVKTYHCSVEDCDKTFITRKEQQNHIARHSAEPRYYCEFQGCNCKYTTKSSLDLHVTRIHAEKRFQCDLCEERYSVKGDLNQHMKRKHSKSRRN